MPRRYRSTRRQDPKQPPAGGGRGAAGDPVGDPARGARRRAALEASLRNLSISSPSPERHRASLAASMARLAVADAQQEDTAFEDAARAAGPHLSRQHRVPRHGLRRVPQPPVDGRPAGPGQATATRKP